MEKGDAWQYLGIVVMFGWMMVTPFLFPYSFILRYSANMMGMVVAILVMVATNQILTYKASEYTHLRLICRPRNKELHVFFSALDSEEDPKRPGFRATALTLGEKLDEPDWGRIDPGGQIALQYWGDWGKRVSDHLQRGRALFRGQWVWHNQSATLIVYESSEVVEVDHLMPVPIYEIAEAPGDWHLSEQYFEAMFPEGTLQKQFYTEGQLISGALLLKAFQEERKENHRLRVDRAELQRQKRHWKDFFIRGEGINREVKGELHSVMSWKSDAKQGAVELALTAFEATTSIKSALRMLKGPTIWSRMLVLLIVGVLGVTVFLLNPGGLLQWLEAPMNMGFVLVLVLGGLGLYWHFKQRR